MANRSEVRAANTGDGFHVKTLEGRKRPADDCYSHELLESVDPKKPALVRYPTRHLLDVDLIPGEVESVTLANGQSIEAQRYEVTGDLNITVWYTPEGEWVKLAFPARGADIEYVLTEGYTGTRLTQAQ